MLRRPVILFLTISISLITAGSAPGPPARHVMPAHAFPAPSPAPPATQYDERPNSITQEPHPQQEAAAQLLQRLLPGHAHLFLLCLESPSAASPSKQQQQRDSSSRSIKQHGWFSVQALKGRVHVHGSSGVELASGVHWFLKHFAGCSVSWHATGGLQLSHAALTPAALAAMESKGLVRVERAVPFSFYQNVVTMSYSMAFWDWDRCGAAGAQVWQHQPARMSAPSHAAFAVAHLTTAQSTITAVLHVHRPGTHSARPGVILLHLHAQTHRWEAELDWMALQGINMPLMPLGMEALLTATFTSLGLTPSQLDDFFSGPAFLAWVRGMTRLECVHRLEAWLACGLVRSVGSGLV